ncbi:RNA polymerase subunit sigma-24 [Enemella dayhoffiae]|uniref:RNA polymerase subunit sigma-24 n=1 Tax=Enemella dayhoffiae TaxID=2016507 RepID=A0A255H9Q9_9ACTN|nr:RNA polymerase sigma factor SigJ [Enemella dayhoffiae]OYO24349.1 RNA polymerase subunit sigma-24 [Enemella dayhoffiae]
MTEPDDPFSEHRARMFAVAYRILGSVSDTEDVLQDCWLAWREVDPATVREPRAYLTRMVANRALNRLRTVQRQREVYPGPWLPEPVAASPGPDEVAELAESASFAMLVLLEQLTPLERAAFVLREVFALSHAEAAEALESTPAAVRQLTSRARRHLAGDGPPRFEPVDADTHRAVGREFVAALRSGDPARAIGLLAPDVRLITDGGGRVQAALRPLVGPEKSLRFLAGLVERYGDFEVEEVTANGWPALLVTSGGQPSLVQFALRDGRLAEVWVQRNPEKLTGLGISGAGSPPSGRNR